MKKEKKTKLPAPVIYKGKPMTPLYPFASGFPTPRPKAPEGSEDIPDGEFLAFCIEEGYANAEGHVIREKAAAVKKLDISVLDILSLEGLAFFPALEDLQCAGNKLTTLDVSGCPALKFLYCLNNRLESINLKGCPELVELDCSENKLVDLNLSANKKLVSLECSWNHLSHLHLKGLKQLEKVYCTGNQIDTISFGNRLKSP